MCARYQLAKAKLQFITGLKKSYQLSSASADGAKAHRYVCTLPVAKVKLQFITG